MTKVWVVFYAEAKYVRVFKTKYLANKCVEWLVQGGTREDRLVVVLRPVEDEWEGSLHEPLYDVPE